MTRVPDDFASSPGDVRSRTAGLIREREASLAADTASAAATDALDGHGWQGCAEVLIRLFATAVETGEVDYQGAAMRDVGRYCPPLSTRALVDAAHHAERTILDELALDDRLGATSEPWPIVARAVRRGTLEIIAAYADLIAGRDVPIVVRDGLTTLISAPVFELALWQEVQRARRHKHSLALLLFDIDDLAQVNRLHGWGVGDRILERLGILARRFFRTHDWVARHGDDAIAVLLPEATLDQAASLAVSFNKMVQQRLVLVDHKTETSITVTLSAAAVGTDRVQSEIDVGYILGEAEAAVLRAKLNGGNRLEHVALLPTSLTLVGAATLLGRTPGEVGRLVRTGVLKGVRRGRHFHIARQAIEEYRARHR